ncbi:MAG: hypothetical protein AAGB28_04050 [Pseudomonadota bacterium]
MQRSNRSSIRQPLTSLRPVFAPLVQQVFAFDPAIFRSTNYDPVCGFTDLVYAGRDSVGSTKLKLSVLEICCILLAGVVAMAGFVGAASALISVI